LEINLLAETERVELLLVPGHPGREKGELSVCFDLAQTTLNKLYTRRVNLAVHEQCHDSQSLGLPLEKQINFLARL